MRTGLNPTPSAVQKKAVEELNSKLSVKGSSKPKKGKKVEEEEEESIQFDMMSRTRVILFEGKVGKKSIEDIFTA